MTNSSSFAKINFVINHTFAKYLVFGTVVIASIIPGASCMKKTQGDEARTIERPEPAVVEDKRMANVIADGTIEMDAAPSGTREEKPSSSFQLQNVKPEVLAKSNSISNPYNSQFLPLKTYARLTPIDFRIGELLDTGSLSMEEKSIFKTLEKFMNSIMKGEIDKDTIDEAEFLRIFRLVSPSLSETAPVGYRPGKIKMTGRDDASVPLRVFGKAGSSYGSIYFIKKESGWYVADVQLDFSDYAADGNEKFMPSSYNNWMY